MSGRLFVVATPIGNLGDASERARDTLRAADGILAEDTRRTRALLGHLGIRRGGIERFDAAVEAKTVEAAVSRLLAGAQLALVSDAGTPVVSDPGALLVREAAARGVVVEAVPGPSAVMVALASSGFAADQFRFLGFLPRSGGSRREALARLLATEETAVFFESPARLARTLSQLAERMPERPAAVARELTKMHEEVVRGTLGELAASDRSWKGEVTVVLGPQPQERAALDVEARIEALLAEGLRDKDVAKAIALETELSASEAYRLVLAYKEGR